MNLLSSQSLACKTVCSYKKSLQQGYLQYMAAEVILLNTVWFQLTLVIRVEVDKRCVVLIKIVHGIWVDGVDCFSLHSGKSAGFDHWITPKSQP